MEVDDLEKSQNETELFAAVSFAEYFTNRYDANGILFHICRLQDAIKEACYASLEHRKLLLLYFHNSTDPFSENFCSNLLKTDMRKMLEDRFFLLGWDVTNEDNHNPLISTLSQYTELAVMGDFIRSKTCMALVIVPVKESITIFSCIKGKVTDSSFMTTMKGAKEFLLKENEIEQELNLSTVTSANDIGSENYQQLMLNLLGDRDYDSFDYTEHDQLRSKIGYALYGPPQEADGYSSNQNKRIESLMKIIVKQNNKFTKWRDRIVISFIYNCTEPLPSEKLKRVKKHGDAYNPSTDLTPVPVFVVRKCKNSQRPCRIFVDDTGRVYTSWANYLNNNKLGQCEMVVPRDGRYEQGGDGRVQLERLLSPACGINVKILQGTDLAGTAAALTSGGIVMAAAIPTIAVAPVALVVAGAVGVGAGLYSMGRNVYTLFDRKRHKETLSLGNSEARGAYFNIVAGSLGFVGAGANVAVAQLATRGVNIGQGATAAVDVIKIVNVGASGASVVNSGYDLVDKWLGENQRPSLLSIVQLSSSILFFGHAVFNMQMTKTVIAEAQTDALAKYQASLHTNKERRAFNELLAEAMRRSGDDAQKGRADVIKTIRSTPTGAQIVTHLNEAKEQLMDDVQIDSSVDASGAIKTIKFNGVDLDMAHLTKLDPEVVTFMALKPTWVAPSQFENITLAARLSNLITASGITVAETMSLARCLLQVFAGNPDSSTKDKVTNTVALLLNRLVETRPNFITDLNTIFPYHLKYFKFISMVNEYFQLLVDQLEEQYQSWAASRDPQLEQPLFLRLRSLDKLKRGAEIFTDVTAVYFKQGNLATEALLKKMVDFAFEWIAKQICWYKEQSERRQVRGAHTGNTPSRKITCPECGGEFYRT